MRVLRWLALGIVLLPLVLVVRGVESLPLYSAREKLQCLTCHVDPNGGGVRNEFGFTYAVNRHSLAPEAGKPWGELALTNRVGENMPLYLGLNLREMFIATTSVESDSLDRAAFFQMESGLHLSFQPHPLLATSVTVDAFEGAPKLADAYGMLRGGPWGGYLKLGRIRNPFGLRMDDHTVATRNGFLDFTYGNPFGAPRYLPYDPRTLDEGVEVGASSGAYWGRASLTNGSSDAFFGSTRAQAKAVKLGSQAGPYQGALSFYDDFNSGEFSEVRRSTRWGYYAMLSAGRVTFLGEAGAGTDDNTAFSSAGDRKVNLTAAFGELDYSPAHPYNLRLRYDWLKTDRDDDDSEHARLALEGEWSPVPFAELRLVLRRIEHVADGLDPESQFYLQGHLTY
jgi:hypothetical protein